MDPFVRWKKMRKESREHQSKLSLLYLLSKIAHKSLELPMEFRHLLLTNQLTFLLYDG